MGVCYIGTETAAARSFRNLKKISIRVLGKKNFGLGYAIPDSGL